MPWGTPLPRNLIRSDEKAAATKKPYISNVVEGAVAGHPIYFISVPVSENGAVAYFLHMTVDLTALGDLIQADIVPGQIAGILDRNNMVMARTEGIQRTDRQAGVERLRRPDQRRPRHLARAKYSRL